MHIPHIKLSTHSVRSLSAKAFTTYSRAHHKSQQGLDLPINLPRD